MGSSDAQLAASFLLTLLLLVTTLGSLQSCDKTRKVFSNESWGVISDGPSNYTKVSSCPLSPVLPRSGSFDKSLIAVCFFDFVGLTL